MSRADFTRPDNNPKSVEGSKKPPLYLIPPAAKVELAAAMAEGARKYGAYNWRENSVAMSVYLSALERHKDALLDGEDRDPETQIHHAGSIMACAAIILDALATGNLIDDRPLPGKAGDLHRAYDNRTPCTPHKHVGPGVNAAFADAAEQERISQSWADAAVNDNTPTLDEELKPYPRIRAMVAGMRPRLGDTVSFRDRDGHLHTGEVIHFYDGDKMIAKTWWGGWYAMPVGEANILYRNPCTGVDGATGDGGLNGE